MSLKFITSNEHKFKEVQAIFSKNNLEIEHLPMKYTELQADSTEQIAMASATSLSTIIKGDFLIEDSGLSVKVMKNFPGPYSSYVYQTIGWRGILKILDGEEDRQAFFNSVFVLYKEGKFHMFSGNCSGKIASEGRGKSGFGFDPIFVPDGYNSTFAEMSDEEKNKISHRSISINKVLRFLKN